MGFIFIGLFPRGLFIIIAPWPSFSALPLSLPGDYLFISLKHEAPVVANLFMAPLWVISHTDKRKRDPQLAGWLAEGGGVGGRYKFHAASHAIPSDNQIAFIPSTLSFIMSHTLPLLRPPPFPSLA